MASEVKFGLPWCMNCVGFHPDELPTRTDMIERMLKPQATIIRQAARFEQKIALYRGKVCCLCGRAYRENGELDQTWELTARFVKLELEHAGIYGVGDGDVQRIVANCRKAVSELFKFVPQLQFAIRIKRQVSRNDLEIFDRLTFAGRLSTIVELARHGRQIKLSGQHVRI